MSRSGNLAGISAPDRESLDMSSEADTRDDMVRLARSLFERGLSPGSSGNLSARVPGGFIVTPTDASFGFLDPATLTKIDENGTFVSGDRPTKEVSLHLGMYRGRPELGAVTHLHSTWCVCMSCLSEGADDDLLPPFTPYLSMTVGKVARLPFHAPGDTAVGPAIAALAGRFKAIIIRNHGSVVGGRTVRDSVFCAEELEESAKIAFLLSGRSVVQLTPQQLDSQETGDRSS